MKKIIHVLSFSPPHDNWISRFSSIQEYTDYYLNNIGGLDYLDIDEEIGRVFFYKGEFHHLLAVETLKRTSEYEIEFWRPYYGIKKMYESKVEGVTHRIFPAERVKPFYGLASYVLSEMMNRELKKEISSGNVLLSLGWPTKTTDELLIDIKPKFVPVLVHHRSGMLTHFQYPNSIMRLNPFVIYRKWKEELCCKKYIDVFQCTIKLMRDYVDKRKLSVTLDLWDGIDFDFYLPASDKDKVKAELNITLDKKVILYVGRFYRDKDADFLINAYKEIKKIRNDLILIMIGGYVSDEFYQLGNDVGAIMLERVPQSTLVKYHQASDVYILPTRNYTVKNFGGIGAAIVQSLACNVPVISDNLMHFCGGYNEIGKVGKLMGNQDELINSINFILSHPEEYAECRNLSSKYYEVNTNMSKLLSIYKDLFIKYNIN